MLMSEAQKPMTVPKELLSPPSEFNPTLLMFLAAIAMFGISNFGYWLWEWPHWCCFVTNTIALHICGTVIHDSCHQSAHRNSCHQRYFRALQCAVVNFCLSCVYAGTFAAPRPC
jgi:beta-carotene hydroxylase